jgi:hypothetical protein
MTPKLARDSSCLLVRLRGVSGFTIRKQVTKTGDRQDDYLHIHGS